MSGEPGPTRAELELALRAAHEASAGPGGKGVMRRAFDRMFGGK